MIKTLKEFRSARRSFFCPNKLWNELEVNTNDCMSISSFIKQAIIEKLQTLNPKKADYYKYLQNARVE